MVGVALLEVVQVPQLAGLAHLRSHLVDIGVCLQDLWHLEERVLLNVLVMNTMSKYC